MVLLRKVIGDALRARRLAQHRTLREVSTAANVSLGYLSEIERGHKEASSELLASICDALGARLSEMLGDVSATFALAEQMEFTGAEQASVEATRVLEEAVADNRVTTAVSDGDLTVQVHSDGPLRTRLTAMKRTTPPQRNTEPVYAASALLRANRCGQLLAAFEGAGEVERNVPVQALLELVQPGVVDRVYVGRHRADLGGHVPQQPREARVVRPVRLRPR